MRGALLEPQQSSTQRWLLTPEGGTRGTESGGLGQDPGSEDNLPVTLGLGFSSLSCLLTWKMNVQMQAWEGTPPPWLCRALTGTWTFLPLLFLFVLLFREGK